MRLVVLSVVVSTCLSVCPCALGGDMHSYERLLVI